MIALQWTVLLPRDYDMERVRARIAEDAPSLDEAPGLVLCAHGLREAGSAGIGAHHYTAVSIWANTSRMGAYLWGEGGLERVRAQYGHLEVGLWPVAGLQLDRATIAKATALETGVAAPDADASLSTLGNAAKDDAAAAIKSRDIHAAVRGLDVGRGRQWRADVRTGQSRDEDGVTFSLAHLSLPAAV